MAAVLLAAPANQSSLYEGERDPEERAGSLFSKLLLPFLFLSWNPAIFLSCKVPKDRIHRKRVPPCLKHFLALAGRLSWLGCHPMHQKVVGSIPSQGTHLGCGFNPWLGHLREATNQCLPPSAHLPPSHPLPLSKISKHILG